MPDQILPVTTPDFAQEATVQPPSTQLKPIDVSTDMGIPDYSRQGDDGDLLSKMARTEPDKTYEPSYFDWDKTGAQKFVNDKQYKTKGFDPELGEGNELKNAQGDTGWDEFSKGLRGFGATLVHGFKTQHYRVLLSKIS